MEVPLRGFVGRARTRARARGRTTREPNIADGAGDGTAGTRGTRPAKRTVWARGTYETPGTPYIASPDLLNLPQITSNHPPRSKDRVAKDVIEMQGIVTAELPDTNLRV